MHFCSKSIFVSQFYANTVCAETPKKPCHGTKDLLTHEVNPHVHGPYSCSEVGEVESMQQRLTVYASQLGTATLEHLVVMSISVLSLPLSPSRQKALVDRFFITLEWEP